MESFGLLRSVVIEAVPLEGALYECSSEDGPIYCFDTCILCRTVDGEYIHERFCVRGAVKDEEGYWHPNFNYKNQVQNIIDLIHERGYISLDYWFFYYPPSLEDRLAYDLRCEEEEKMGWS